MDAHRVVVFALTTLGMVGCGTSAEPGSTTHVAAATSHPFSALEEFYSDPHCINCHSITAVSDMVPAFKTMALRSLASASVFNTGVRATTWVGYHKNLTEEQLVELPAGSVQDEIDGVTPARSCMGCHFYWSATGGGTAGTTYTVRSGGWALPSGVTLEDEQTHCTGSASDPTYCDRIALKAPSDCDASNQVANRCGTTDSFDFWGAAPKGGTGPTDMTFAAYERAGSAMAWCIKDPADICAQTLKARAQTIAQLHDDASDDDHDGDSDGDVYAVTKATMIASIKQHFTQDGRVLYAVRQHASRYQWIHAVETWLDMMEATTESFEATDNIDGVEDDEPDDADGNGTADNVDDMIAAFCPVPATSASRCGGYSGDAGDK